MVWFINRNHLRQRAIMLELGALRLAIDDNTAAITETGTAMAALKEAIANSAGSTAADQAGVDALTAKQTANNAALRGLSPPAPAPVVAPTPAPVVPPAG